ncbi:short-chain dehydrogenase [Psychrobacillus sp. NPDC058041]|uniref:short-chain dehydrogenase n=1 Tax=Psychrobacillus sp. NPDC058041 TaxID=3346310 RepID=UPI0036DCF39A
MKHVCLIGGTGMLAEVTKWYADNNHIVSVVARNEEKMNQLKNSCSNPENIKAVYVDYRDFVKLNESLKQSINRYGTFSEAIIWIHSDALLALPVIFELLEEKSTAWQILGSKANAKTFRNQYQPSNNVIYNFIQLGFIRQNNSHRWLTNTEIADGVICSILSGKEYSLIGEVSN